VEERFQDIVDGKANATSDEDKHECDRIEASLCPCFFVFLGEGRIKKIGFGGGNLLIPLDNSGIRLIVGFWGRGP
jgi:hypothetical protein